MNVYAALARAVESVALAVDAGTGPASTRFSYRPFIDPINAFHNWWFVLLIPMSLGVAVVYKAIRVHDMRRYWREVAQMTAMLVLGMMLLGAGVFVFIEGYVQFIADFAR